MDGKDNHEDETYSSLVVCGLGRAEKEPNLQNPPLATFYHFGASWKAVITQSLTFEQRQIKGQSWWQNWPIVCAL